MRLYTHLSAKERQRIEYLYANGFSQRAIARKLDRHLKTIQNELKRLKTQNYDWNKAYEHYRKLRLSKKTKIGSNPILQRYIKICLSVYKWTPEQIAGRLRRMKNIFYVCCKTIYSYINKDKILKRLLPQYNSRRIFKNIKQMHERQKPLPSIHLRDESGTNKSYEGDLMRFGKSVQNVTTLFNRSSKLVRLIKNETGSPDVVIGGILKYAKEIDILTMDRGVEFKQVNKFIENGIVPFYCDAMAWWQKGGCENTNGRVRRELPKKMDPNLITQE